MKNNKSGRNRERNFDAIENEEFRFCIVKEEQEKASVPEQEETEESKPARRKQWLIMIAAGLLTAAIVAVCFLLPKNSPQNQMQTTDAGMQDIIPPTARAVERTITIDERLDPLELVTDIQDESLVALQWERVPHFGVVGDELAVVKITDEAGNETLVEVPIHIRAVKESITLEIGQKLPEPKEFLLVERSNAYYGASVADISWTIPGNYDITVCFDEKEFTTRMILTDTQAPTLTLSPLAVLKGASVSATQLVETAEDETALSFVFEIAPDTTACGTQEVVVTATDLGGNCVSASTQVVVADHIISRESSSTPLPAKLFAEITGQYAWNITMPTEFVPSQVGVFSHQVDVMGVPTWFAIVVRDTTAPQYVLSNATACVGYSIEPEAFFSRIIDESKVIASYVTEPDWSVEGVQSATIELKDACGNITRVESTVNIVPDTVAPTILGVKDRYCYVGEAVAYFAEASASDNADPAPTLQVDSSQVNIHAAGIYPVTYTATDAQGNTATKTVNFTFIESKVSQEELDALVDTVFAQIMTEGMSTAQQAKAIYDYVYSHIIYDGTSDKTDWRSEAYRGITTGYGDCFTFYSVAYLLLSNIDCEVLSVERYGWDSRHYWCLVNLGNGWYHFDTINVAPNDFQAFMKTADEVLAVSIYYWDYNEELYPPLATEPFEME